MVPPYPAAIPGAYSLEVNVYRGYWMIEWFKREFGGAEVARAELEGVEPEALFDELHRGDPAGLDGPDPAAVLVARRAHPGPRGEGRRHRLGRRPHAGAPVPRDHRGARLRAARGRRADGRSGPRCRSASCGSRAAARRARPRSSSSPTSSGCRLAAAHPRDVRARRGDRRGRRPRPPSVVRGGGGRDDPDRGDPRARPDRPTTCTRTSTAGVYLRLYERLRPLYAEIRRITGYPPEV